MAHTLMHICGPFSIHSFGVILAFGLMVAVHCAVHNPLRARIMSRDTFFDTIIVALLAGLVGSRLLFALQNWDFFEHWTEVFQIWTGGFSVLGSVIGILMVVPWYLVWHRVSVFLFFDLIALYAPLLQSIARLGCFFAGCCFGLQTTMPWGIVYSDVEVSAPLYVSLHPTQLYSAFTLFGIFLIMIYWVQNRFKKPGSYVVAYLFLMSIERFGIDFFRGDREFFESGVLQFLSIHQWIALGISIGSCICMFYQYWSKAKESVSP